LQESPEKTTDIGNLCPMTILNNQCGGMLFDSVKEFGQFMKESFSPASS
jgi:hypothetical protein